MIKTENNKTIVSRILKTENINWHELVYLQSDEFKDFSPDEEQKLRNSVLNNQFNDPFKVWFDESTNTIYCLDGKHRSIILGKLIADGISVPELLPGTFIYCTGIKDAARLVLQYSSHYARTTESGMIDFMAMYNLAIEDISLDINIPEIDFTILYGDANRDFGMRNEELNIQEFTDEVTLTLTFTREDYIAIKQRLTVLMGEHNVSTPEELIKIILK